MTHVICVLLHVLLALTYSRVPVNRPELVGCCAEHVVSSDE